MSNLVQYYLPIDNRRNPIPVATGYLLQDATGTPIESPISAGTGAITLIWPANAIGLQVLPTAKDVLLTVGTKTFPLIGGQPTPVEGKGGDSTVIARPDSTEVSFKFITL